MKIANEPMERKHADCIAFAPECARAGLHKLAREKERGLSWKKSSQRRGKSSAAIRNEERAEQNKKVSL